MPHLVVTLYNKQLSRRRLVDGLFLCMIHWKNGEILFIFVYVLYKECSYYGLRFGSFNYHGPICGPHGAFLEYVALYILYR